MEGEKLVSQRGFHVPCSEEQEGLGQAMGPMDYYMGGSEAWNIEASIHRKICGKSPGWGFKAERREIADLR